MKDLLPSEASPRFYRMFEYIDALQDTICDGLESHDTAKFQEDLWERPQGGGGRTRVLQDGSVFEKGGVNISAVHGMMPPELAAHMKTDPVAFSACGLSLVIHPKSPKIPTTHMNVRYFEMGTGKCWYGGGIDLTPYYPDVEGFQQFHRTLKEACDGAIPGSYDSYKAQCDEYFTIKHRQEMRGIGGVFFDYLDGIQSQHEKLVQATGDCFLDSYLPRVVANKEATFTEDDKTFQLVRRGRYVEFNLVYDRGTLFGLKTNGRTESILMSLPAEVQFRYDWHPSPGTPHEEMLQYYQPRDWVS